MSREELVGAYLSGQMSRRSFVRRLVAAGVSVGAAVSYAHLLEPQTARAADPDPDLYAQPNVVTDPPSELGADAATLSGQVDPNQLPTHYWFEWGTTAAYGHATTAQLLPLTNGFIAVSASLGNLDPGRTYHYRVVAENTTGRAFGNDVAFAIPDTTDPSTRLQAVDTDIEAVVRSRRLRILCRLNEPGEVALSALLAGGGGGRALRRIVLAKGKVSSNEPGERLASLRLTRAGTRALARQREATVTVRAKTTDLAGNTSATSKRLRLS